MIAEVLGTYFVIFAGCAAGTVNIDTDKVVTFPGISIVWGLVVMVMVYSVGHISGAHFNPAVTIAFATCRRFPWKQVCYLLASFSHYLSFLPLQMEIMGVNSQLSIPTSHFIFSCLYHFQALIRTTNFYLIHLASRTYLSW